MKKFFFDGNVFHRRVKGKNHKFLYPYKSFYLENFYNFEIKKNLENGTIYLIDNIGHLLSLKQIFKNKNVGFFFKDNLWFMIKDKNYSVISCSPETLIEKKGRSIITKPIAGTLKKNASLNKSKALQYFRKNIKETKEHNMIVDMERSDLSRICVPGSVKIKKEKTIEEYKDLFHYVSLIKGKLSEKVKTIDIVKSMMPGGSVIGCPKINTLNLLNKQEKENRNIYTGSFGYIKFNGDMRFNIIIRSILNFKNTSEISVASGVVIDSNANHEFNENFIKAKALIDLFK